MSLKLALSARSLRAVVWSAILVSAANSGAIYAQAPIPGIDSLAFTDHRGETFENFDFRGRDLSMGKYEGAKLRGASFAGAEIDRVTFDKADLSNTTGWAEADLGLGIEARAAILDGADLAGATCDGSFEWASFRGADLSNATLSGRFHGASFDGANVTGALFLGAGGTEALHDDLRARGAIVDKEDFAAAIAAGRSFRGTMLDGVALSNADLSGIDLDEASLHSADLIGSDLSEANLQKALLAWAEAEEANFEGATLSEAICVGLDARGASFRDAKLVATEMSGVDLQRADLTDADLTNADLRGADLAGANLQGAKLDGVQIDDAILDDVKGLSEDELASLQTQAARWQHDLERGWQDFLRNASLPLHLALSALALGLLVVGGALGRAKPAFVLLAVVNGAAFVPFALFVLFLLAGGSPVVQMSNYEMWSMWVHGWPLLLVWVGSAGVIGAGLALWEVVEKSVIGPRNELPLSIAMGLATPLNCFFALQVLFLIAPDA